MNPIAIIGIDLGKNAFHIHCQDKSGNALLHKKFTRNKLLEYLSVCEPTTVVMEACSGAHFMARRITDLGHEGDCSPPFRGCRKRPALTINPQRFIACYWD